MGGGSSIFDNIAPDDQIIAFFPCTRFENQITMDFRGENYGMKNWSEVKKLNYDIKLHEELHNLYTLICKMAVVCLERKIPLIIENPKGNPHYLTRYWCLKPSLIDGNRKDRGDYYNKPTQYWFINRKPSNNLVLDVVAHYPNTHYKEISGNRTVLRSMISPDYANRFIREFII